MKKQTTYQVWHVKDTNGTLTDEMLQEYDTPDEALEKVLDLGDRSILATIRVKN